MPSHRPAVLALTLVLAVPPLLHVSAPRAETLGEAIDVALAPAGAAALSALPPELLGAVHLSSTALAAHRQGLSSAEDAAAVVSAQLDRLAAVQPQLGTLSAGQLRAGLLLQGRVSVAGARALVDALPAGAARAELLRAAGRLTVATGSLLEARLQAADEGPDHACFQQYAACMDYCAQLWDAADRSLCGMDCNLDFVVCLGGVLGEGGLSFLEGLIELAGARVADAD
jgi:hypothetical protein